jgi:hypothetical protein
MASVSVKIPTDKVIAMIEQKIADLKVEIEKYPASKSQFALDKIAYEKSLVQLTIDALTNHPELIGENRDDAIRVYANNYSGRSVNVSVDADALGFPPAPVEPKNPNDRIYVGREYVSPLEILENTLKTLRLTEQETINASTYSNVMKLL